MFQIILVHKIKTHVLCSITSIRKSCPLWDKVENYCRATQATKTIRRMRFECWLPKATNAHSQYVIGIAFPLQQLLHERVSMLRYTYIAGIVQRLCYSHAQQTFHFTKTSNTIFWLEKRQFWARLYQPINSHPVSRLLNIIVVERKMFCAISHVTMEKLKKEIPGIAV